MKKVGRPTKYRKEFLDAAARMWTRGANDDKVSQKLGISRATLNEWVNRHPEFADTRRAAKAVADDNVEEALYNRAIGSVLPDCHVSVWDGNVTVTPLKKHYPPEVAACSLWLRNRRPKEWRDKTELALADEIAGVPQADLEAFRKRFLQRVSTTNGNGNGH